MKPKSKFVSQQVTYLCHQEKPCGLCPAPIEEGEYFVWLDSGRFHVHCTRAHDPARVSIGRHPKYKTIILQVEALEDLSAHRKVFLDKGDCTL